ncbi:MAG: hypothetical protein WAW92_02485 [Minisyncoccia bacterium]
MKTGQLTVNLSGASDQHAASPAFVLTGNPETNTRSVTMSPPPGLTVVGVGGGIATWGALTNAGGPIGTNWVGVGDTVVRPQAVDRRATRKTAKIELRTTTPSFQGS